MAISTQLNFGRDVQGFNAYAPQFPTDIFTATLAAGAAESVTVPSNNPIWIMYVRRLRLQVGVGVHVLQQLLFLLVARWQQQNLNLSWEQLNINARFMLQM